MTTYIGVEMKHGPWDGHRVVDVPVEVYYITDEKNERGMYKWDGHTVNPRRFWWQGWEKDGYLPV